MTSVTGEILEILLGRKGFDAWWEGMDACTQRQITSQIDEVVFQLLRDHRKELQEG